MSVDTVLEAADATPSPRPARRTDGTRTRRLVLALCAGTVGLVGALVAFAGPAAVHRTTITWRPADDGPVRPLALLGGYPQRLTVHLSCETARALTGAAVVKTARAPESSSGLAIVAGAGTVQLAVGARSSLLELPVPPTDPCAITARFVADGDVGRFELRAGERAVHRLVDHELVDVVATEASWPRVVALHADPLVGERRDVVVRLVTTPAGSSPTTRQLAAVVVALVALMVATVALLRGARDLRDARARATGDAPRAPSPRVTGSDGGILAVALSAMILIPPFWDDGWVRATIGGYPRLGVFSNYYSQADFAQPLGYWWAWMTHAWSGTSVSLVAPRVAPLVLVVASWWILRRFVVDAIVPDDGRRFARGMAALVYVLGAATYLMTLRPEPLIGLLETLALVAVVRFARRPGTRPLLALGAVSALALTTHQTGWVVAFTSATVLPGAVRWASARDRPARTTSLAATGMISGAVGVLLLGLDSDARLVRSGVASFRAGESYQVGFFDSPGRRFDYLEFVAGLQRFWPLVAAVVAVMFAAAVFRLESRIMRSVGYAALAGYAGVLMTGSPWPWHAGAIVPAVAVLAPMATAGLLARGRAGWPFLAAGGAVTVFALTWAMRSTRPWTTGDLAGHDWRALPRPAGWTWALIALAASGAGFALARRRWGTSQAPRGAVMAAAAALLCVPLALTWGLLVVDAAGTSAWSYTRQAIDEITGDDRCGVGASLAVVRDARPLAEAPVDPAPLPRGVVGAFPATAVSAAAAPFGSVVWGTYGAEPVAERGTPLSDAVSTPWFDVRGVPEVVFWSVGQAGPPNVLRAEVLAERPGGGTTVVPRSREPAVDTPWWSFHRVRLSPRARALRLVMRDRGRGDGSWLATTAPFGARFISFERATAGRAVWRNPDSVQALPCRRLPAAPGGVFEPFSWSLGPPAHNGTAIAAEYPTIERGCLRPRVGGAESGRRFCAFELLTSRSPPAP